MKNVGCAAASAGEILGRQDVIRIVALVTGQYWSCKGEKYYSRFRAIQVLALHLAHSCLFPGGPIASHLSHQPGGRGQVMKLASRRLAGGTSMSNCCQITFVPPGISLEGPNWSSRWEPEEHTEWCWFRSDMNWGWAVSPLCPEYVGCCVCGMWAASLSPAGESVAAAARLHA